MRHDSDVQLKEGAVLTKRTRSVSDTSSARRRQGDPLAGCVPTEPDSISPSASRTRFIRRFGGLSCKKRTCWSLLELCLDGTIIQRRLQQVRSGIVSGDGVKGV